MHELDLRAEYDRRKPLYLKLNEEVTHILEKELRRSGIRIAAITHRVKPYDAFVAKVEREHAKNPFADIPRSIRRQGDLPCPIPAERD